MWILLQQILVINPVLLILIFPLITSNILDKYIIINWNYEFRMYQIKKNQILFSIFAYNQIIPE